MLIENRKPLRELSLRALQAVSRWFEEIVVWGARHHPFQNRGGRLTAGRLIILPDSPEKCSNWRIVGDDPGCGPVAESHPNGLHWPNGLVGLSGSLRRVESGHLPHQDPAQGEASTITLRGIESP